MLMVVGAVVAAGLCGCSSGPGGGGSGEAQSTRFNEIAELLRSASSSKPPTKVADLSRFEQRFPDAYQAIKSGAVVVVWGGAMQGEGAAASGGGPVIAYEKDTPTAGGYVLLTSGEVKKMSAAEFNAAPKAGNK
jgi:hypothetical protein